MSALLPVAWVKGGRIEKKVISEHKKLAATSDIDAKVLYVKLARGLPTFGVHFFLVKVRTIQDELPRSRMRRVPSPAALARWPAPRFSADDGT